MNQMTRTTYAALAALTLVFPCATRTFAQAASSPACEGTSLSGTVRDTTLALLPDATVTLDANSTTQAGPDGRFRFACVASGSHRLTAVAEGFAPLTMQFTAPRARELDLRLQAGAEVSITVQGDGDDSSSAASGGSITLAGKQLDALADDPDDLLRQLQQLAAASGGSPSGTVISVDGFSDSSKLPPKDSIAFINASPDLFSAEYREPPFGGGGRVEVYTKPGAKAYHGALFATNSSSFMNARDAFTTSTGSLGKQRYGFDLTGPIRKQGSNFTLNLEHRAIDETVAVNAITPDANGNPVTTLDTVPVPQRLWEGNARVDWQLGPKNIAFVSFSANVNSLQNLGVGGQTLRQAGYNSGTSEYTVRGSDVTTVSDHLVHEARVSFAHNGAADVPLSIAPGLQVAGYFTGGGASIGNERDSHSRTEFDDDIILTTRRHSIKTGEQLLFFRRNFVLPTNFNGNYIFAGGTTATSYQTPLQQYQQAASAGGSATEFSNVAGNPVVITTQVRFAAFFQDTVKLSDKWSASYGLRYALETDPANFNAISPRAGLAYTVDKKKTLVLHTHVGIFNGQFSSDEAQEFHREDGVQRVTSLIYNPTYGSPFAGATPIHAERTLAPGLNAPVYLLAEFTISKDLPMGFNANAQIVGARLFTDTRTVNINQPTGPNPSPSPFGPRPFGANLDILQARNDGTGQGHGEFYGLSNFKLKHAQFFLGGLHLNIRDDTNDSTFNQPQSAYTNAGETARRTQQSLYQVFGNGNFTMLYKVSLSMNGYANSGHTFNITTGNDNNGDGNFNDRPQYAAAGSIVDNTTVFNTPFGVLTNNGPIVNGIPLRPIARNAGVLPWAFHIDANLQRAFKLTKDPKAARQQTLTANIRSANFLNHTNVTAEGSVLNSSPQFLAPVSADTARRIEFGLRYSF